MRWKNKIIIALCLAVVLVGCSTNVENKENTRENDANDSNEEANTSDADEQEARHEEEENETGAAGEDTLAGAEVISFEEVDADNAVRIVLEDLDTPFDTEGGTNHLYYGDNAFVTAFITRGAFAYDISKGEVIWEKEGILSDYAVHDDTLYIADNNKEKHYAHIEAISFDDGEITDTYEKDEMSGLRDLQILDDFILFATTYIDDSDGYLYFQVMNKDTHDTVEMPTIGSDELKKLELDDGILVTNTRPDDDPKGDADTSHFVNMDKETGERLYTVEAEAVRDTPVKSEQGVYYLDHIEDQITMFDFDGELIESFTPPRTLNGTSLLVPIVTETAFIFNEVEGISWFEKDLSHEMHRVELGNDRSHVYAMQATDDRLYVISSEYDEEDEPDDSEDFYLVEMDLETGEIYEKVDLEIANNGSPILNNHVYNNKFHFSIYDEDEEQQIDYIFSNGEVNKP